MSARRKFGKDLDNGSDKTPKLGSVSTVRLSGNPLSTSEQKEVRSFSTSEQREIEVDL